MKEIRDGDSIVDYWVSCKKCGDWVHAVGRATGETIDSLMGPGENMLLESAACGCGYTMIAVPPTYESLL